MKFLNHVISTRYALLLMALVLISACRRDLSDLEAAKYPDNPIVFLDDFSSGLQYAAFGGSDVRAFEVDREVAFNNSAASIRFQIPDANSPSGSYAGGVFYTAEGRDLTRYDALTFWAKASQPATVDLIGFGNDLGASAYEVSLNAMKVNSGWKKYIIPIPDPSKLTMERGMLVVSEGPENDRGYTLWIDEVKFEKLGTISEPTPKILNGEDRTTTAETGDQLTVGELSYTVNLPDGTNQTFGLAKGYFTYESSNTAVATVAADGSIRVLDAGTAKITSKVGGTTAKGSLTINSTGTPVLPATPAPIPTQDASKVISLYSNAYPNRPVDTWNTGWQFSTAQTTFIKVANDDIIRYRKLNFVGIEFTSNTVDASAMTHFRMDIWTPDNTALPRVFRVKLVDFGADNKFGGNDDSEHEISISAPTLKSNEWVSLDVPMASFSGLTSRKNLAQMVLSGDIPNVYVDNVYFYEKPPPPAVPTVAAPTPTRGAANVLSVFSDAYTNIAGTDFNPNWGQATVTTIVPIAGNSTYKMLNLNYQGIQLGAPQNVTGYEFVHFDVFAARSTTLKLSLVSPGKETPVTIPMPTTDWTSVSIPLSSYASVVDLSQVIQFKFEGDGEVYVDNIYFYKNPTAPSTAAPTPTVPAADVISVFSDAYTNVAGTDYNPNWGQATTTSVQSIAGNNTYRMLGLNYQGIQLGSSQNVGAMKFLHIDYWTSNSTSLKVFLISPGPIETPVGLTVPTNGEWRSLDIPLTSFAPVNLAEVIQFKFEGNGNIFIDNIYFKK